MKIKFELGQKVYSKTRKEFGIVVKICPDEQEYPIYVDYKTSDYNPFIYTADGRYHVGDEVVLIEAIDIKINKLLNI